MKCLFCFRDILPSQNSETSPRRMRNASIVSMAIVLMTLFRVIEEECSHIIFGVFGLR